MSLTRRQRDIYSFLESYLESEGCAPTLEEIADHFGMASLNGVFKHLSALEEKGFIRRLSNRARSIALVRSERGEATTLPLLGSIAAGRPIEAVSNPEQVSVPGDFLSRRESFALRVEGDSMIDEQIRDGDLVIVEKRDAASNGQMVVALVNGESTTLKKYFREGSRIRLQPAHPTMQPIYADESEVRIQGIVVGLIRRY